MSHRSVEAFEHGHIRQILRSSGGSFGGKQMPSHESAPSQIVGSRISRFVCVFPDSCALRVFEFVGGLPSGAIRSTHWGESLHPPASTGANRSSAGALLPDSCANFPIRARFGIWHGVCMTFVA